MDFENRFKQFLVELGKSPYDLPSELHPYLKSALISAGFNSESTYHEGNVSAGSKATRKLSGYNLFMKDKMAELKAEEVPSGERMGRVSLLWKNLNDSEKSVWNTKAQEINANNNTSDVETQTTKSKAKSGKRKTGTYKLSGYQLFVKEKMSEVIKDTSITPKERMGRIGSMWKTLTEIEQNVYKQKAETQNSSTQSVDTN